MIEILALTLAFAHFAAPLTYYAYVRKKWLPLEWGLKIDKGYRPVVAIIVPTYNEEELIEQKLDNIYLQTYPRDKLRIIVVDSASEDKTVEIARRWSIEHPDIWLKILEEPVRRGMNPALNYALRFIPDDVEIVVFTDTDSLWEPHTLESVVQYFADEKVGAVTTNVVYIGDGVSNMESTYRAFYNLVRVGESKFYSTPVHNGTLVAYRLKLLKILGGLPEFTGNNDSTPASLIAFMGYRAIQIDDTTVAEPVRKRQVLRKIRRAQHLILGFLKAKRYAKRRGLYVKSPFDLVWNVEWWLHIVNPLLFVAAIALLFISIVYYGSLTSTLLALSGSVALVSKMFRTWVVQQLILFVAMIRTAWTKDLVWKK